MKQIDEEEIITEKPKEKSAEPEPEKKKVPEVKRKSIGEKKPKKAEEEPKIESIDEPDFAKADGVTEDDVKKPASRRGSKKEKSPEKTTPSIEVHYCFATQRKNELR